LYFLYLAEKKFAENYINLQSPQGQTRTARGSSSFSFRFWRRFKFFFSNWIWSPWLHFSRCSRTGAI